MAAAQNAIRAAILLILVHQQLAARVPPSSSSSRNAFSSSTLSSSTAGCPKWFLEYEAFHSKMRGKPGAKYLIYDVATVTGGLGDRLRGMMYTVRAAYALNRVALFTWRTPADVSEFLHQPAGSRINWSLAGTGYQGQSKVLSFVDHPHPDVISGALQHDTTTFIKFLTNREMNAPCYACPDIDPWGQEAVCLWHRLFAPNDDIVEMAEAKLQEMYGGSHSSRDGNGSTRKASRKPPLYSRNFAGGGSNSIRRYVGVHLRLGGLSGEFETQERGSGEGPLANTLAAVRCAHTLAAQAHIDTQQTPILLVTDNHKLRAAVQDGYLVNVTAPSGSLPVHLDRARGASLQQHKNTFVDLVLLGKSHCLVTSNSGYSHQAYLYGGGKPCHTSFATCLKSAAVQQP